MPTYWQVILDGHPLKMHITSRREAEAMAERWQVGLLKQKDRRDYVEVKRDHVSEREFDESYDRLKRGSLQPVQMIDH